MHVNIQLTQGINDCYWGSTVTDCYFFKRKQEHGSYARHNNGQKPKNDIRRWHKSRGRNLF
jgi:hypothetical protein